MTKGMISVADIRKEVEKNEAHHINILREGLKATIAWIAEHLDLYRPGRYEV